jgi:biofilm PGA synthesis protein PgaD
MRAESIVIQRPYRQTLAQRAVFGLVTVVLWVFWVFLWLPLLTLAAWVLGIRDVLVQLHLFAPVGQPGDIHIVLLLAIVTSAVFTGWSMYNYARFVGRQRRRGNHPVDVAETARRIGAATTDAIQLQNSRRAVISVSDEGFMTLADHR